jgi:hypothetical protein
LLPSSNALRWAVGPLFVSLAVELDQLGEIDEEILQEVVDWEYQAAC